MITQGTKKYVCHGWLKGMLYSYFVNLKQAFLSISHLLATTHCHGLHNIIVYQGWYNISLLNN